MNIVLWIVQVVLALLCLSGGAYKTFSFDEVAKQLTAIPRGGWSAIGVFEMVAAVLLVAPAAMAESTARTRRRSTRSEMRPAGSCMTAPAKIATLIMMAMVLEVRPALAPKTAPSVPKAPLAMPISTMPTQAMGEVR